MDAGLDVKGRLRRVALGEKYAHPIGVTRRDRELRGHCVEVNRARNLGMHPPDVDRQAIVDENEQVVITRERKRFSTLVGED